MQKSSNTGEGLLVGDVKQAATKRPPRPFGLSRERIVTAAIAYLRDNPSQQLSIAKAASAVGATPMTVYRHFHDGSDLAAAILDRTLDGLFDEIPDHEDWHERVRAWLNAVYGRFADLPQSIELLGSARGLSTAMVRACEGLREILRSAGFQDPHLTEATFWLSQMVIGFARNMLSAPLGVQIEGTLAAIDRLDPDGESELSALSSKVPELYERAQELSFERMIVSIDGWMNKPG